MNYLTNKSISNALKSYTKEHENTGKYIGLLGHGSLGQKQLRNIYKNEMIYLKNLQNQFISDYSYRVNEILYDILFHQLAIDYHRKTPNKIQNKEKKVETTQINYGKKQQEMLITELKQISQKGLSTGIGITQLPMWGFNVHSDIKMLLDTIIAHRNRSLNTIEPTLKLYSKIYLKKTTEKLLEFDPNINPENIGFKYRKNKNTYILGSIKPNINMGYNH